MAAPAGSNRNLEIVRLKGATNFAVRDITDILHPVTVATFTAQDGSAQFVGAGEVSFIDAHGLELMQVATSKKKLVSRCASLFAWSPDGKTLAFVDPNEQLHLVTDGHNSVVASMPTWPGGIGCENQACADTWEHILRYSPNGEDLSLVEWPPGEFRIWSSDGKVLESSDFNTPTSTALHTMSAWSSDTFYFLANDGVETWRAGTPGLALPGVAWIRPRASPGGGMIVYETRDKSGMARIHLLNTRSNEVRDLGSSRSEPAFLNTHLIWYQEERACQPSDNCIAGLTTPTGRTFIYDLADNTEIESPIAEVLDEWPHPA